MAFKPRGRLGKGKQPLLQLESLTRCELRSSKTESARRGGEAASSELLGSEVDDPYTFIDSQSLQLDPPKTPRTPSSGAMVKRRALDSSAGSSSGSSRTPRSGRSTPAVKRSPALSRDLQLKMKEEEDLKRALEESRRDMEREERMQRRQRREEKEEQVLVGESVPERAEETVSAAAAAQTMSEAPLATNKGTIPTSDELDIPPPTGNTPCGAELSRTTPPLDQGPDGVEMSLHSVVTAAKHRAPSLQLHRVAHNGRGVVSSAVAPLEEEEWSELRRREGGGVRDEEEECVIPGGREGSRDSARDDRTSRGWTSGSLEDTPPLAGDVEERMEGVGGEDTPSLAGEEKEEEEGPVGSGGEGEGEGEGGMAVAHSSRSDAPRHGDEPQTNEDEEHSATLGEESAARSKGDGSGATGGGGVEGRQSSRLPDAASHAACSVERDSVSVPVSVPRVHISRLQLRKGKKRDSDGHMSETGLTPASKKLRLRQTKAEEMSSPPPPPPPSVPGAAHTPACPEPPSATDKTTIPAPSEGRKLPELFAPDGVDPARHTPMILHRLNSYFHQLRLAQGRVAVRVPWSDPVPVYHRQPRTTLSYRYSQQQQRRNREGHDAGSPWPRIDLSTGEVFSAPSTLASSASGGRQLATRSSSRQRCAATRDKREGSSSSQESLSRTPIRSKLSQKRKVFFEEEKQDGSPSGVEDCSGRGRSKKPLSEGGRGRSGAAEKRDSPTEECSQTAQASSASAPSPANSPTLTNSGMVNTGVLQECGLPPSGALGSPSLSTTTLASSSAGTAMDNSPSSRTAPSAPSIPSQVASQDQSPGESGAPASGPVQPAPVPSASGSLLMGGGGRGGSPLLAGDHTQSGEEVRTSRAQSRKRRRARLLDDSDSDTDVAGTGSGAAPAAGATAEVGEVAGPRASPFSSGLVTTTHGRRQKRSALLERRQKQHKENVIDLTEDSQQTVPSPPSPASPLPCSQRSGGGVGEEEGVACPLCLHVFPQTAIEEHAASCEGEEPHTTSPAGGRQQPRKKQAGLLTPRFNKPRRSSFPASASPSTTSARPGWVEEDWRDEEDEEEEEEEEEVGSLATSSTHSDPCSVAGPQVYQCEGGGYRVDPSTVSSSPIRTFRRLTELDPQERAGYYDQFNKKGKGQGRRGGGGGRRGGKGRGGESWGRAEFAELLESGPSRGGRQGRGKGRGRRGRGYGRGKFFQQRRRGKNPRPL